MGSNERVKHAYQFTIPTEFQRAHSQFLELPERFQEDTTKTLMLPPLIAKFFSELLSGNAKSIRDAALKAGYTPGSSGTMNSVFEKYRHDFGLPPIQQVARAFRKLATERKDAPLLAMDAADFSIAEIAGRMGMKVTAVRNRLEKYRLKKPHASPEEMAEFRNLLYGLLAENPDLKPTALRDILIKIAPDHFAQTDPRQLRKRIKDTLRLDRKRIQLLRVSVAKQLTSPDPSVNNEICKQYSLTAEQLTLLKEEFNSRLFKDLRKELTAAAMDFDSIPFFTYQGKPRNIMANWQGENPTRRANLTANWWLQQLIPQERRSAGAFAIQRNTERVLILKNFVPTAIDDPIVLQAQHYFARYIARRYQKAERTPPVPLLFLARELFLEVAERNRAVRNTSGNNERTKLIAQINAEDL